MNQKPHPRTYDQKTRTWAPKEAPCGDCGKNEKAAAKEIDNLHEPVQKDDTLVLLVVRYNNHANIWKR